MKLYNKYNTLFSGWSFRNKLYIVFILSLLSNTILIVSLFVLINIDEQFNSHAKVEELQPLQYIAEEFRDLSDIHSKLFNMVETSSTNHDEESIYVLGSSLIDRLDILSKRFTKSGNTNVNEVHHDIREENYSKLQVEIERYRGNMVSIIEMLTVDPALSKQFILPAANGYNQINNLISIIISDISVQFNSEMDERIILVKNVYWPLVFMLLFMSVGMVFFLVKIMSDMTSSFLFVENSLDKLRRGDTDLYIPNYEHDKTMKVLASGIEKFRKSIIDTNMSQLRLSETNQQLQSTLADLTRAKELAEVSNQAKSNFLSNMSHELRTPLNAVLGVAQILEGSDLDEEQKEYVDMLVNSGNNLLDLLTGVLDYSRYGSGDFKLEYEQLSIHSIVNNSIIKHREKAAHKGVVIKDEIAEDISPILYGDPKRVQQVLDNIVGNAVKFSNHGIITIRVNNRSRGDACKTEFCPNNVSSTSTRCHWYTLVFEVEDEGIGIAQEKQANLFAMFSQADETTTREYGGVGMGLAITKQLVDLMDGETGVRSEVGRGSVFWFTLCFSTEAD